MRFLYIFLLMFLSIFGLAMLIRSLWEALLGGARRRFAVYVKEDDDLEEFVRAARSSGLAETINIMPRGAAAGAAARRLAEKYADVRIVGKDG